MAAPKGNKYAKGCKTNGRPTKYDKSFCEKLLDHMGQGLSYESFGAEINVNRDTLYAWEKKHQDFSDAKKLGREKQLLFFEKLGIAASLGKIPGFNGTAYVWSSKNMVGWTDKVETDVTSKGEKISINYELDS